MYMIQIILDKYDWLILINLFKIFRAHQYITYSWAYCSNYLNYGTLSNNMLSNFFYALDISVVYLIQFAIIILYIIFYHYFIISIIIKIKSICFY